MLYREMMAVCSVIHTKHINTAVWGRTWNSLTLTVVLQSVTTVYRGLKAETVNVDTPLCSSERPLRSLIHL